MVLTRACLSRADIFRSGVQPFDRTFGKLRQQFLRHVTLLEHEAAAIRGQLNQDFIQLSQSQWDSAFPFVAATMNDPALKEL